MQIQVNKHFPTFFWRRSTPYCKVDDDNAGFYGTVGGVLQGPQRAATLMLHVFGFRRQIPQGMLYNVNAARGRKQSYR